MTHKVFISGQTSLLLWGINPSLRLERQLRALKISRISVGLPSTILNTHDVIIDGTYVFDSQLLQIFLAEEKPSALVYEERVIGLTSRAEREDNLFDYLGKNISELPEYFNKITTSDLPTYNDHLRRSEPPLLMPVTLENLETIEGRLYGNSYKGVTDFITKWVWPKPARRIVKTLSSRKITPNMVTLVSLLLVIASSILFANGHFIVGLALGWFMTFLDTVDGKLARVTVTSSRIGHVLDHGMDIIHPPIWYACWASGLLLHSNLTPEIAVCTTWWILGGYVLGRVVEGLFHILGNCSIFAWRPFDAVCRLFTARRNPCLLLLTIFTLFNFPELGLFAVCGWTLLSSSLLVFRFFQAVFVRLSDGPLDSWLKDEEVALERYPQLYKAFSSTQKAYE